MVNNKKNKTKKEKKEIQYRTKQERQNEVKHILEQLSEFQLNPSYEPVKKLYLKFKEYINEGQRIIVNIPEMIKPTLKSTGKTALRNNCKASA